MRLKKNLTDQVAQKNVNKAISKLAFINSSFSSANGIATQCSRRKKVTKINLTFLALVL